MERKRIKSSRYLAAFLFTIVIFLIGYIIGTMISEQKLQKVYDLENDIRTEAFGNELVFLLVHKELCEDVNLTSYTGELTGIGKRLTYMETIYGFDAPQVLQLKNYYTLLLIRHWMLVEEMRTTCDFDKPTVLYFYTNDGSCVDCEDQGLVLTYVHRDYAFFNIYSFEYGQSNPALDFLKQRYNIQKHRLPTLVVNGEVFYGFQSKDFLLEELELDSRLEEDMVENPWRYE